MGALYDKRFLASESPVTIAQEEPDATLRRILIYCVSREDGVTPVTSLTWLNGSQLKVGFNFIEFNFTGTVTEIGAGYYYYEATIAEVTPSGVLSLRVNRPEVADGCISYAQVEPQILLPIPQISPATEQHMGIQLHLGIG